MSAQSTFFLKQGYMFRLEVSHLQVLTGLKYNLGHKPKHWIRDLGLEAECAVTLLPPEDQEYTRYQVAKQLKKLQTQQTSQCRYNERRQYEEMKDVNSIRDKLRKNKAPITKANKESSIIIVYQNEYEQKVLDFISNNGAEEVNSNITTKFQKDLRSTINNCKLLIDTENKGRFINLNRETPLLRGLLKIHKEGTPICPVVNLRNAPSYKLAKMLTDILNTSPDAQRM